MSKEIDWKKETEKDIAVYAAGYFNDEFSWDTCFIEGKDIAELGLCITDVLTDEEFKYLADCVSTLNWFIAETNSELKKEAMDKAHANEEDEEEAERNTPYIMIDGEAGGFYDLEVCNASPELEAELFVKYNIEHFRVEYSTDKYNLRKNVTFNI